MNSIVNGKMIEVRRIIFKPDSVSGTYFRNLKSEKTSERNRPVVSIDFSTEMREISFKSSWNLKMFMRNIKSYLQRPLF